MLLTCANENDIVGLAAGCFYLSINSDLCKAITANGNTKKQNQQQILTNNICEKLKGKNNGIALLYVLVKGLPKYC